MLYVRFWKRDIQQIIASVGTEMRAYWILYITPPTEDTAVFNLSEWERNSFGERKSAPSLVEKNLNVGFNAKF